MQQENDWKCETNRLLITFCYKMRESNHSVIRFRSRRRFEGEGEERHMHLAAKPKAWSHDEEPGGELAVDVYQTGDAIVVKALIAGVQPNSIDINLTREMITITGSRQEEKEVEEDNYFQRELYWGSFSRTILLPQEIDVEVASASAKDGLDRKSVV